MQTINFRAFTLVELIVVITIVGILSTVGFVSYSGYLTGARDSNRISQLTKLSDSLQVYASTKGLPLPDDYLAITQSGSITSYQGVAGVDVLETIDYTNGGKDPKDGSYYSYAISKDRKKIQLLAFMEENSNINFSVTRNTYAVDYSDKYPKVYGKKIGILLRTSDNMPIDQISGGSWGSNLETINEEMTAYFTNSMIVTGTGAKIDRAKRYHAADFTEPYVLVEFYAIRDLCLENLGGYVVVDISSEPGGYVVPEQYATNSEFSGRLFMYCDEVGDEYFISKEGDFYAVGIVD